LIFIVSENNLEEKYIDDKYRFSFKEYNLKFIFNGLKKI
jgi:hypothetical protein